MSKPLWTVREHRELPTDIWESFKARSLEAGHSPNSALGRLIRRYLARGFDDGLPETREPADHKVGSSSR
jgi:hypothetical protein